MQDSLLSFSKQVAQQNISEAISLLTPSVWSPLNLKKEHSVLEKSIICWADSLWFGTTYDALITSQNLKQLIEEDISAFLELDEFYHAVDSIEDIIKQFIQSISKTEQTCLPITSTQIEELLKNSPKKQQALLSMQFKLTNSWIMAKKQYPALIDSLCTQRSHPSRPFCKLPMNNLKTQPHKKVLIFLLSEAFFQFVLNSHEQADPILFAVLDSHPITWKWNTDLPPLTKEDLCFFQKEDIPINTHTKDKILNEILLYWNQQTSGDSLYSLGKQVANEVLVQKFSTTGLIALAQKQIAKDWRDPNRPKQHFQIQEGLTNTQLITKTLNSSSIKCTQTTHKQKIRLAHIVPQIVDKYHAPSKLLSTLIQNHSYDTFDIQIYCTERLTLKTSEYPVQYDYSESSHSRGKHFIQQMSQANINTAISLSFKTYKEHIHHLLNWLNEQKIHIAVFHGPDVINSHAASSCSCNLRVLFEHGTLPEFPAYDLVVASTPNIKDSYVNLMKKYHTNVVGRPFAYDVRKLWINPAPNKEDWGVPKDGVVLTTISNHLDHRLTPEMCTAIGKILKDCPKAYYLPIGPINNPKRIRDILSSFKVNDRVCFLGPHECPSHLARSMDVYLNEFPFGSCLGMLDAMASGCPPVTMYDPKGPAQAKYGGEYYSLDRSIKDGNIEAYIELACQLISNKHMYQEWSALALKCYEKHSQETDYTRKLEKDFLHLLHL